MSLEFISSIQTLSDAARPMFPGISGLAVRWVTLKARTNGFTILPNLDEEDGFTVAEGATIDIPINEVLGHISVFNMNMLYWKNTTLGSNCIVEIFGQREV